MHRCIAILRPAIRVSYRDLCITMPQVLCQRMYRDTTSADTNYYQFTMKNLISVSELLNSSPHDEYIISVSVVLPPTIYLKTTRPAQIYITPVNDVVSPRTTAPAHGHSAVLFLELQ